MLNTSKTLSIGSVLLVVSLLVLLQAPPPDHPARNRLSGAVEDVPATQTTVAFWKTGFEENLGQFRPEVVFSLRNEQFRLDLTRDELILQASGEGPASEPFRIRFPGAASDRIVGRLPIPGTVNYLVDSDPENWKTGIARYQQVRYENLYPGIDLACYLREGHLEFDFEIAPGKSPESARFQILGAESLVQASEREMTASSPAGELLLRLPRSYQMTENRTVEVEAGFHRLSDGSFSFRTGEFDPGQMLVIDPVLTFSAFLGGFSTDTVAAVALDPQGNIYLAGSTRSDDFPTLNPIQAYGGNRRDDVFVTKLNPTGTAIIYSTFIGGGQDDQTRALAVDSGGRAFVGGRTSSTDFPIVNGYQSTFGGGSDGFVARLNAPGTALLFSSYLGGEGADDVQGLAVDTQSRLVAAGLTDSTNFPVMNAFQPTYAGGNPPFDDDDGFLTKFTGAGNGLLFSTYFGGTKKDSISDVALGPDGAIYVTGTTHSSDFPTTNGFDEQGVSRNAFVAKFNPAGTALNYSSYLGGNFDIGDAIAVDAQGHAYLVGTAASKTFPTKDAFQPEFGGFYTDAFLSKVSPSGGELVYSTFLGGAMTNESAFDVAVGTDGSVWVVGVVESLSNSEFSSEGRIPVRRSGDFPLAFPLQSYLVVNPQRVAVTDAFISRFDPSGRRLLFSTYLGGSESDTAHGVAPVGDGSTALVAGSTTSADFPRLPGGLDLGTPQRAFLVGVAGTPSPGPMAGGVAGQAWTRFPLYDSNDNHQPDEDDHPIYAMRESDALILPRPDPGMLAFNDPTLQLLDPHPLTGRYTAFAVTVRGITEDPENPASQAISGITPQTFGEDEFLLRIQGRGVGFNEHLRPNRFQVDVELTDTTGLFLAAQALINTLDPNEDGLEDGLDVNFSLTNSQLQGHPVLAASAALLKWAKVPLGMQTELLYFDVNSDGKPDYVGVESSAVAMVFGLFGIEPPKDVFWPLGDSNGDGIGDSMVWDFNNDGEPDADMPLYPLGAGPADPEYEHRIYFAQFGNGAEAGAQIDSQILLFNLDREQAAQADIQIRNDAGNPLTVRLNGALVNGNLQQMVPAGGVVSIRSDGAGPIQSGSVSVTSNRPVAGVILFGGNVGRAGVANSALLERGFVAPMETRLSELVNTGVAVMNPEDRQLTAQAELISPAGTLLATSSFQLPPFGHLALFVDQLDWDPPVDLIAIQAGLRVDPDGRIVATVIRTRPGELATMPVAPNLKSLHFNPALRLPTAPAAFAPVLTNIMPFAQFGDGGELIFSQIILQNLDLNRAAAARIEMRDDTGLPLSVDLNGQLVEGQLDTEVPAGGLLTLKTDQLGPIQAGSVRVSSDRLLSGVILYGGAVGLAGVGRSPVSPNGFLAPVVTNQAGGLQTGIAFVNFEEDFLTIQLRLLASNGTELSRGTVGLEPLGHLALFIEQIQWQPAVNVSRLLALIEATAEGNFTGTVIQTSQGLFATLPVVPIP